MDLVEIWSWDYVDRVWFSAIVSCKEAVSMSDIKSLRGSVRRALELVAAARMIGDQDALKDAEKEAAECKQALAVALVSDAREVKSRGVSKADESARKSPKLS